MRVGTAMAVAGAMPMVLPMVLAVDASPLTQLDAELPSVHGPVAPCLGEVVCVVCFTAAAAQ